MVTVLIDFGTIAYSLSSFFLLFLAIAQLRMWNQGNSSMVLLIATAVTLVWSSVLIFRPQIPLSNFYLVQLLEILKNVAWIVLLLSTLGIRRALFSAMKGEDYPHNLVFVTFVAVGIPGALMLYILYIQFFGSDILFYPAYGGRTVLAGFLLVSITGLALLEQVIRNIKFHQVWHLKFLCLSLGMLYSYDIYLYSEALLFERIQDQLWQARGGVTALATPLIAISVLRARQQPLQVNISRRLVFHTSVLIASGIYLLLMGMAGYYIRNVSGEWGLLLQAMFWVISLTLLVILVYSGRFRSFLKLYINRHLFSSKYDYRHEWMRISEMLSETSVDESLQERIIHALADIVDSPSGALWITLDDIHYDQTAHLEMGWVEDGQVTSNDYLISSLARNGDPIDLTDPESEIDPAGLPDWFKRINKAWLIIPLVLNEKLLGFVLLKESRVDFELNWEDFELMKAAGQQAASYLSQSIATEALSEVRQFAAFNQLSAFIVHDLKTLNSQLSMLVKNAERHKDNPAFVDDMIKTTDHAVDKMTFLLKHFQSGLLEEKQEINSIDIAKLLSEVVESQTKLRPLPSLDCEQSGIQLQGNAEELKSCFGHLIQNAQEATPDEGFVEISLKKEGDKALIQVKDSGSGMTPEFINTRLFRPFDSSKGVAGMGMGVFQSRSTIRNLGGDFKVYSEPKVGTTFTITLPALTEPKSIAG